MESQQPASVTGIDLDPSRRPGVPRERQPASWPNTRYPPSRQQTAPSVPKHGRPGKRMPPVYGTAVPLHGLSGLVRKTAYRYPDHWARHWTLLLFADRVDSWERRTRRLARVALPLLGIAWIGRRLLAPARR
jgi:hypothetical protein